MSKFRSTVIVGLAGLATMLAVVPGAQAQATCEWYGRQALKQQQENQEKKCNFSGPEWSSDMKAHMTWCASVAPDVSKKAAQSRDVALASCPAKK
jgi:hypothetical protein